MAPQPIPSVGPAPGPGDGFSQDTCPFVIVLLMMLKDIDAQGDKTEIGLEQEMLSKDRFDVQQQEVVAEQEKLRALLTSTAAPTQESIQEILAQIARVQASQSKLSFMQNKMVQQFRMEIDPAQQMIQNDSVLFGGALHDMILTENIRVKR